MNGHGRRGRRVSRVIGWTLAASLLGACGGLPSSSPVGRGLEVGANDYAPIRLQFDPPAPGASPQQIVDGFLLASSSDDDDYSAARLFLTGAASSAWTPRSGVTVYSDSNDLTLEGDGEKVSVRAPVRARLDSSGRYYVASPGEVATSTLGLTQVAGEWRISELPDDFGLWLTPFHFGRAYGRFALTYADPVDRSLISDYRWFRQGQGLATSLAKAQLADVPPYLQGAAVTGFPPKSRLAVDSVPIVENVAQVELSTEIRDVATVEQRRSAWAQMFRTLRQVQGVTAVSLSVEGGRLSLVGVDGLPTSLAALGFAQPEAAPRAIVLRTGTRLSAADFTGWLTGGENQRAVDAPPLPEVPLRWERLAISQDLGSGIGVDKARASIYRWTPRDLGSPPTFGSSLTEPAFDRRGQGWIAGVDGAGRPRIWYIQADLPVRTAPEVIEAPWLDQRVTAVKPAPGGRRLAIALTDGAGQTSVYVSGIAVEQGGTPVALQKPWRIAAGLTDVRDLSWVDDSAVAVVAGRKGAKVAPRILPLGEQEAPLAEVNGAAQIVTTGGERGVVVVSEDGAVWRRIGGGWHRHDEVGELIVPGS